MSDENELFWAAGFLEGEGCFYSPDHSGGSFSISASQTKTREPLDRLLRLFGGCVCLASKESTRKKGHNTQDCFVWRIAGSPAVKAAGLLLPILSERRQEQVINSLSGYALAHSGPSRGDNRKNL